MYIYSRITQWLSHFNLTIVARRGRLLKGQGINDIVVFSYLRKVQYYNSTVH